MKVPIEVKLRRTAEEFSTDKLDCMRITGDFQGNPKSDGETTPDTEQERIDGHKNGQAFTLD